MDIVEGVNNQPPNSCSLHTGPSKIASKSGKTSNNETCIRLQYALLSPNDGVRAICRISSIRGADTIEFSTATGNTCDAYATGNTGCGVRFNDNKSYGPEFNNNGGGWYVFNVSHWLCHNNRNTRYAIERSSSYIKIFFWERSSGSVPSDVKSPESNIDTSKWVRSSRKL